jgi:molecular chaperone DnaK
LNHKPLNKIYNNMSMINFGIDLGTTNSLIARFEKGSVEVFKNPSGFKETLPSVVGFRNNRILVGEQAIAFIERDPKNVVSRFKRKMGTTEAFRISSLDTSKSPVELSAFVLKELKTFIHSGEKPEAVVITIPASFDTVQSNATKEAGYSAGFKQVILLQEPIAASLAYANKEKGIDLRNSQWIVYDLGGGTFDVALVRIVEGELTVVDHEGDNYLGGSDFDALIVENLIVPELERLGSFGNHLSEMKSEKAKYNRLWHTLLQKAEEAKVMLSTKTSADIDFDVEDGEGNPINCVMEITRSDFEGLIKSPIDTTADMLKKILTRNSLRGDDLGFVLMVGGSTYVPYVRNRIGELLGVKVNTSIDPTNAIAIGAAYFAATKEISFDQSKKSTQPNNAAFTIKATYNKASQEDEELFSAKVEGNIEGLFYRITREDGGFDSGLRDLTRRVVEDLPLQQGAYNIFSFKVFNGANDEIPSGLEVIQIAHGKYSVAGQMLPEDLCLVKDDLVLQDTRLDRIFARNSVLPARAKKTVEVGKTIVHGSDDELRIIVVEGPSEHHSSTNKPIGSLHISGKQLSRDVLKGTEIDLTFEMSESRDLTVSAYVNATSQEFAGVFDPKPRTVPVNTLVDEVNLLDSRLTSEIEDATTNESYDVAAGLTKLQSEVDELVGEAALLKIDDVTDDRFKLEDKKRRVAQKIHRLTSGKRLDQAKLAYQEAKAEAMDLVNKLGDDRERHQLEELLAREHAVITSTSAEKVEDATSALETLRFQILGRTPQFLVGMFEHLVGRRTAMNDQMQAKNIIESGRRYIDAEDWENLRTINGRLWDLLPQPEQQSKEFKNFTGIV